MTTVLVLGGARSGKSAYAELLLQDRPRVTYVAPGTPPRRGGPIRGPGSAATAAGLEAGLDAGVDAGVEAGLDTEWIARIDAHRARRPAHWGTHEGGDVAALVAGADAGDALLLDCLGTWITRLVDEAGAWEHPETAQSCVTRETARLEAALRGSRADVVVVSNEVGLGVVPATRSGRLFRDLLGRTNRAVADACAHVALVVAGRVLDLSGSPRIEAAPTFGLREQAAPLPDARAAAEAVGALDSGIDVWADAGFDFSDDPADESRERGGHTRGDPR